MADAILNWLTTVGIDAAIIDPGKPWRNGTNESLNSKLRDECVSVEWFLTRRKGAGNHRSLRAGTSTRSAGTQTSPT